MQDNNYKQNLISRLKDTVPRKWDFSYGTSSCITYFKLRTRIKFVLFKSFSI